MNTQRKIHRGFRVLFLLCAASIMGSAVPTRAIPRNSAPTAVTETRQWRKIHLRHIRPDMMAYWLDSTRQRIPAEYQGKLPVHLAAQFRKTLEQNQLHRHPSTKPELAMPSNELFDGLLSADDSSQELWVLSTQKVFDKTQKIVRKLDHPIPSIDVKVQAVTGDAETMKAFVPLRASMPKIQSAEIQSLLDQLLTQDKIKILASFHIMALNGFTGSAYSFASSAIATPTLNDDNTINVSLAVATKDMGVKQIPPAEITDLCADDAGGNDRTPLQYIETVCTLANNRTIVLGGLRNVSNGSDGKYTDQETIWLITACFAK